MAGPPKPTLDGKPTLLPALAGEDTGRPITPQDAQTPTPTHAQTGTVSVDGYVISTGSSDPAFNPKDYVEIFNTNAQETNSPYSLNVRVDERGAHIYHFYFLNKGAKQLVAVINHINTKARPITTNTGIIFPLEFGWAPIILNSLAEAPKDRRVEYTQLPLGSRYQAFIYLPFNPSSIESDQFDQAPFIAKYRDYKDIGYARLEQQGLTAIPIYEVYPASKDRQAFLSLRQTHSRSTEPVFQEHASDRPEHKEITADNPSTPYDFGLGDLDFSAIPRSAQICMVLDTSGSMTDTVERGWKYISSIWKKIPAGFRGRLHLAAVSAQDTSTIFPLTSMENLEFRNFADALRQQHFRGEQENIKPAIDACWAIIHPEESNPSNPRRILVVADEEGIEESGIGRKKFGPNTGIQLINPVEHEQFLKKQEELQTHAAKTFTKGTEIEQDIALRLARGLFELIVTEEDADSPEERPIINHGRRLKRLQHILLNLDTTPVNAIKTAIDEGLADLRREDGGSEAVVSVAVALLVFHKKLGFNEEQMTTYVSQLEELIHSNIDYPLKDKCLEVLSILASGLVDGSVESLVRLSHSSDISDKRIVQKINEALQKLDVDKRAESLYKQVQQDPNSVQPEQISPFGFNIYTVHALLILAEFGSERTITSALRALQGLMFNTDDPESVQPRIDPKRIALYSRIILPKLQELRELGIDPLIFKEFEQLSRAAHQPSMENEVDIFNETAWTQSNSLKPMPDGSPLKVSGFNKEAGAAFIKENMTMFQKGQTWLYVESNDNSSQWFVLGNKGKTTRFFLPNLMQVKGDIDGIYPGIREISIHHVDHGKTLLQTVIHSLTSRSLKAIFDRVHHAKERGYKGVIEETIHTPHGTLRIQIAEGVTLSPQILNERIDEITTYFSTLTNTEAISGEELLKKYEELLIIDYRQ